MSFNFRKGEMSDLRQLQELALKAWSEFKDVLTKQDWKKLYGTLTSEDVFKELLVKSYCLICETKGKEIIGMAFLLPKGNPTEIFLKNWSYIRFVSVDPDYGRQGVARKLTEFCIQYAKEKNEQIVALHTSEMMYKAIRLYEDLGFIRLQEIAPRLGKKYWLYILELDTE